ncbi:hypothetical protein [Pseudovibrio sp. Ad26]|uniref:hypothetical protein n=1 Tax=Pseudovibrio sp. Ad26 TaxID=989410 RepID=UPI0007AE8EDC|nr:hypothetical protein [Pseudovibrio sp. Ad26]KZL06429.1 hypothetical protein PsAD26_03684 [Pseudovibrio sp. Ad26]
MANFELYKGIVQHSPKSCGAYCVNAALAELGFLPTATNVKTIDAADVTKGYSLTNENARINLWRLSYLTGFRLRVAEEVTKEAYKVSGNLELQPPKATYKTNDGSQDLENSPSGMVAVASTLAPSLLNNIAYYTTFGENLFKSFNVQNAKGGNLFDREVDLIKSDLKQSATSSNVSNIPFQLCQVNLILVQYANTNTMHWVAGIRHPTEANKAMIYDPATGDVLEISTIGSFELQTQNKKPATQIGPNSYEFPGIWIRLGA